jgi:hypothetical protein
MTTEIELQASNRAEAGASAGAPTKYSRASSSGYLSGSKPAHLGNSEPRAAWDFRHPLMDCYLVVTAKFGCGMALCGDHDNSFDIVLTILPPPTRSRPAGPDPQAAGADIDSILCTWTSLNGK